MTPYTLFGRVLLLVYSIPGRSYGNLYNYSNYNNLEKNESFYKKNY
jgi:hypothetical protein